MCGCRFLCEGTVVQCWSRELWNRFVRIEKKGKFSRSVSIWLQLGLNPKIAVNIVSNLNTLVLSRRPTLITIYSTPVNRPGMNDRRGAVRAHSVVDPNYSSCMETSCTAAAHITAMCT